MTTHIHVDFAGSFMPTYGILMALGITGAVLAGVFGIIWSFRGSRGKRTALPMRILTVVGAITSVASTFACLTYALHFVSGQIDQTEAAIEQELDVSIIEGLPRGRYTPDPPYTITVTQDGRTFDCTVSYVSTEIEYNDLGVTCDTEATR